MIIVWNGKKSNPYQAYGFGTVFNGLTSHVYDGKESCGITRELHLVKGGKIKMRARIFKGGAYAETAGNTIRLRIRKVPK